MAVYYYCSRIMPETRCWNDLKQILNLDLEGKKRRITYISGSMTDTLPAKKVKEASKSYRNGAQKNLVQLGVVTENANLIWKDAPLDVMTEQIMTSDIVYLLGGNPLEQMNFLRKHNLDSVLREYPGILIGVSGGAMSLGQNVVVPPCGEKYPQVSITPGIKTVDKSVMPHFEYAADHDKMETKDGYIYVRDLLDISNSYDIIGLPNQSILRIDQTGAYALGDEPYHISQSQIEPIPHQEEQIDNIKIKKLIIKK